MKEIHKALVVLSNRLSYSCTSRLFQFAQLIEFDRTTQVIGKSVAQKNSPSCAHFLHNKLNVAISGCSFADYGKNFCQTEERTCNGTRDYLYSLTVLFCSVLAAVYHAKVGGCLSI